MQRRFRLIVPLFLAWLLGSTFGVGDLLAADRPNVLLSVTCDPQGYAASWAGWYSFSNSRRGWSVGADVGVHYRGEVLQASVLAASSVLKQSSLSSRRGSRPTEPAALMAIFARAISLTNVKTECD